MKKITLTIIFLMLSACGGGSSTSTPAPEIPTVDHFGSDSTVIFDETGIYNIDIFGDRNTITIKADNTINMLDLTGSNNLLTFETGISVDTFDIFGSDNTINVPTGSGITFTSTGSGNLTIEY